MPTATPRYLLPGDKTFPYPPRPAARRPHALELSPFVSSTLISPSNCILIGGLSVAPFLAELAAKQDLLGTGVTSETFGSNLGRPATDLAPRNRALRSAAMPPPTDQSKWFAEAVLPHEPVLRGWLSTQFAAPTDPKDVAQEPVARLVRARA